MYKVVLADDEPLIIKGLKKLINWEEINGVIVGEAENGRRLLELIEEVCPDIVISDIAMPHLTGLDVIKEIKERNMNTKVIFLSGFQEFSYARAAIQYGAVDYLLKPIAEDELKESVLKAQEMLKRNNEIELWEEETSVEAGIKVTHLEQEAECFRERFHDIGIQIEGKVFQGVCFALDQETIDTVQDKNKLKLLCFHLFKKIQEYLKKEQLGFTFKRDVSSSKMIVALPKEDAEKVMDQIVKNVSEMALDTFNAKMIAGIGKKVEDIKEIQFAYKTARFAQELYYFQAVHVIRYKDIAGREFTYSFEDYENVYQEFLHSVLNRETDWRKRLDKCLGIIESLHYGNRYAVENRCVVLAMDFFRDLREYNMVGDKRQAEYEGWVENLRNQITYQKLKEIFISYYENFIKEVYQQKNSSENSIIYQVKEYIKENCASDLNLNSLAKHFYMNPYYLSAFFKKKTGQNFKNYVTEIKMKQALKLLLESEDIKTYELAQAVGYKDVRTFTEKFKEVYKDSPSGYKKQRRLEDHA